MNVEPVEPAPAGTHPVIIAVKGGKFDNNTKTLEPLTVLQFAGARLGTVSVVAVMAEIT